MVGRGLKGRGRTWRRTRGVIFPEEGLYLAFQIIQSGLPLAGKSWVVVVSKSKPAFHCALVIEIGNCLCYCEDSSKFT